MPSVEDAQKFISIHAPSRERHAPEIIFSAYEVFQSTLPRGSDTNSKSGEIGLRDFNPRSLAGATSYLISKIPIATFQSTLPRGSDLINIITLEREYRFQSTLPRGSDDVNCQGWDQH